MDIYKVVSRTKKNGSNKSLLKNGLIPGILYGTGDEPKKIAFEEKILKKLMHSGSFFSKIINLKVGEKTEKVLPKEIQYHPVTDKLIHFDFFRVQDDTRVTVEVPVEYLNQEACPGLKQGGVLNLVRRFVNLMCSANNIPEKLQFDLINTEIGDAIKISNIELPEDIKLTITDRDFVVATLVPPTIEVEPEPKEAAEEGAEESAEEGVEGESKDDVKVEGKVEGKAEGKVEDKKEESSKDKSK